MAEEKYTWTDNPTKSGKAICDTDILNDCLMHLKYDNKGGSGLDDKITNCLLEVPQRIKLELNNGVLTLKAGSRVIMPNGFEADGTTPKFDYVDIVSDAVAPSEAWSTSKDMIAYGNNGGIYRVSLNECYSGSTKPSKPWCFWYDTTNNLCWAIRKDVDILISLPVSIVNANSSQVYTSIDQVFNGMGYIGSTVWVDKGVKGLIPNGRNEDGSLNNIEYTTTSVLLDSDMHLWGGQITLNIMLYQGDIEVQDVNRFSKNKETPVSTSQYVYSYDEEDNYWYYSTDNGVNWVIQHFITIGSLIEVASNKSVSNFQPKLPFRAVDYNDFSNTPHIIDTYQNGASWYRVWSDGWIEQGGRGSRAFAHNTEFTITFLKAFSNANNYLVFHGGSSTKANISLVGFELITRTTKSYTAKYNSQNGAGYTLEYDWYVCGY